MVLLRSLGFCANAVRARIYGSLGFSAFSCSRRPAEGTLIKPVLGATRRDAVRLHLRSARVQWTNSGFCGALTNWRPDIRRKLLIANVLVAGMAYGALVEAGGRGEEPYYAEVADLINNQILTEESTEASIKKALSGFEQAILERIREMEAQLDAAIEADKGAEEVTALSFRPIPYSQLLTAYEHLEFGDWSKTYSCQDDRNYLILFDPRYEPSSSEEGYPWSERAPPAYHDMHMVFEALCTWAKQLD